MNTNDKPIINDDLNMAEIAFLKEHEGKDLEFLAAALKRTKNQIQFELQKLAQEKFEQESTTQEEVHPRENREIKQDEVTTAKKDSPLLNSFVRRKEGGVVAMSGAAAQLSDELTKSNGKKNIYEARPDCVRRVRG